MEQTKVPVKLNDASIATNNNLKLQNSDNIVSNPPNSKLTVILMAIIIFAVLLAFIFILLFVIIKVHKKDKVFPRAGGSYSSRKPIIFDVDEGGDDMMAYIVANNSKKYDILGVTTVSCYHYVEDG